MPTETAEGIVSVQTQSTTLQEKPMPESRTLSFAEIRARPECLDMGAEEAAKSSAVAALRQLHSQIQVENQPIEIRVDNKS